MTQRDNIKPIRLVNPVSDLHSILSATYQSIHDSTIGRSTEKQALSQAEQRTAALQRARTTAGIFAEIYRGIYPGMTSETREELIDFITVAQSAWTTTPRRRLAEVLGHKILADDHAHRNAPTSGISTPDYISEVLSTELSSVITAVGKSLRAAHPNYEQELEVLTSQLANIPLNTVLNKGGERFAREFMQWTEKAARLGTQEIGGGTPGR